MHLQTNWTLLEEKTRRGGQGSVRKVKNNTTGQIGALKELNPEHLNSTERRFRFQREVNILLMLEGENTPDILDNNINEWKTSRDVLWCVMEWIEGPTLTDFISKNGTVDISTATVITLKLLETIAKFHKIGVIHRDVKPDNIILKNGDIESPIIIDFGLAYETDGDNEYKSKIGQELGNRFIRLPELSAGSKIKTPASDLTMLIGIIFYLITGHAPRQLSDSEGKMPHETAASFFNKNIVEDPKWNKLIRIFNVGFQIKIDMRFQDCETIKKALMNLEPNEIDSDGIFDEIDKLKATFEKSKIAQRTKLSNQISELSNDLDNEFRRYLSESGLVAYGSRGFGESDLIANVHFGIHRPGIPQPVVNLHHRIIIDIPNIKLLYKLDNEDWVLYNTGLAADLEGIKEKAFLKTRQLFAKSIACFREKLEA